jgi:glucose-6-phosphate isomerase
MRIETINIPPFENKPIKLPQPEFLTYEPDFDAMHGAWKKHGGAKNILIIGHGGSVSSAIAFVGALPTGKNVKFLSTVDPDYIQELRQTLRRDETIVIAISKSGETVTQLEALMHFMDYPLLFVTERGSSLDAIARKIGASVFPHPSIGGRYTAFTEVGLLPAAIAGIDVKALFAGAKRMYLQFAQDNLAGRVAQTMYALEQLGYVDVFLPFYSHRIVSFADLIVQLCHESFGKNGVGQTYFAHEAPESQHHTNQRFFGGRKNVAGLFTTLDHFHHNADITTVPANLHSIPLKSSSLFELNKIPLSYAMHSEFFGTWEDAKTHRIPCVALHVGSMDATEIGAYAAFWQIYAVYSSLLRDVDPFDQPQVESSKKISWEQRLEFKHLT